MKKFALLYRDKCHKFPFATQAKLEVASHADVLRLVTRSSLRTSAWEAKIEGEPM